MLNAERFKEEINKHNNEFGLADNIVDCGTLGCRNCRFSRLNNSDGVIIMCSTRKVKWLLSEYKEPIKLTRLEYDILKYLSDNTKHMYIVRNKDGKLCIFDFEPVKNKVNDWWSGRYMYGMVMFDKLFQFIKWEDSTPTLIKDVLENCEVVNDAEE
ncbi:hypothetical protein [Catenibacterium faecis]|uniref:hypothetical protein n=1 Tax=Catenibacterium faecis TaxID=2764323 RepID=UPI003F7FD4CA